MRNPLFAPKSGAMTQIPPVAAAGGTMAIKKHSVKQDYGNDSISSLKGAERVRKRPGVIFGSDGLDGCEHAVFEILSNSIDEAREGHGN